MIATLVIPSFKTKYFTDDEMNNTKTDILSFLREYESRSTARIDLDVDEPRPAYLTSDRPTENAFSKN